MSAILAHREVAPLLSDENLSVDGTLIKAGASMKSFQPMAECAPPDEEGPGDPPRATPSPRTRLQKRKPGPLRCAATTTSTATPRSISGARSVRTVAIGTPLVRETMVTTPRQPTLTPSFTRNPLAPGDSVLHRPCADGEPCRPDRAERPDPGRHACITAHCHRHDTSPVSRIDRTADTGADKGFDGAEFVANLRQACVTRHVAQKAKHSAIDGRITRHNGYALSTKHRKRIEESFGWANTVGGIAQTVYRGVERVRSRFILTMAANNLARLPWMLAA